CLHNMMRAVWRRGPPAQPQMLRLLQRQPDTQTRSAPKDNIACAGGSGRTALSLDSSRSVPPTGVPVYGSIHATNSILRLGWRLGHAGPLFADDLRRFRFCIVTNLSLVHIHSLFARRECACR